LTAQKYRGIGAKPGRPTRRNHGTVRLWCRTVRKRWSATWIWSTDFRGMLHRL